MRRKTCSSRALVGVQGRRGSASRLPGQPPNLRRQVGPVARREEQTRLAYSQLYCSQLYYSQLSVNSSPVSPSATRLDSPPAHSLRVCAARVSFFLCHGRHQNRQPAMRRRLISAHLGRPRLISAQSRPISARPRRRRRRARPKPSPRARRNPASPSRRASPAPNQQVASPQSCHAAVARRLGGHSQRRPPPRTRARGPRPAERLVKMKSPMGAYFFFTRGPRPRRTPANTAAAPANSRRKLASGQTSQREVLTVGEGRCESKL